MATTLQPLSNYHHHSIETMAVLNSAPKSPRRMTRRKSSSIADADMAKSTTGSFDSATNGTSQDRRLARKRAARACDQCRRRKSRCDGQPNCSACQVIGLQCGYGERIKQSRGPSYVAHLEKKVEELEGRVSSLSESSTIDAGPNFNSPPTGGGSTAGSSPTVLEFASLPTIPSMPPDNWTMSMPDAIPTLTTASSDPQQFTVPDQQSYIKTITRNEPRGKPYGIDILRQLWNFCNRIISPPISNRDESSIKLVQALDSLLPVDSIPVQGGHPLLPAKANVLYWLDIAFSEAFELYPFVDRAAVEKTLCRIYNTSTFGQDESDRDELALLYALLALGQRFDAATPANAVERRTQGLQYFAAAKAMVPLANCDRNTAAIQTVLCLALYLKAGSALTRVHAYLSAAASAALRMGMHERTPCFSETDRAIRQRLWSTIYILNVYVSASLGIPHTLPTGDECGDPFPSLFARESAEDSQACASHFQLVKLFNSCVERMYCRGAAKMLLGQQRGFSVPTVALQACVEELDSWAQNHIASSGPMESVSKSHLLLTYSHAYIQLLLFSPFIHHLAQPTSSTPSPSTLYATKALRAATTAISTAEILHKRLQLTETSIDVLAFAAMSLLVVEMGSADPAMLGEAIRYGKRAKELLLLLSLQSAAAAECWQALAGFWDGGKGVQVQEKRPVLGTFPDSAVGFGGS